MNKIKIICLTCLGSGTLLLGGVVNAQPTLISAPTDSQIAKIVETVNNSEIKISQVAENSSNAAIRSLAKHMVKAHTASNVKTDAVMKGIGLPIEDSQTSNDMKADAAKKLDELKKLQGPAFDKAYIDTLVSAHQAALDELNSTLIPNAKNPKLISLLKDTRNVVRSHLDHARDIQTAMAK